MSSKTKSSPTLLVIFIIFSILFTRFVKLNWGSNYYFQPDENNMAIAISNLKSSNLDPKFFAYGQFPLYLSFFTLKLAHLDTDFSNAILMLRLYSAVFSVVSVYLLYLISKYIFDSSRNSIIFILLIIFNPGLIQLSHFGTTESLLILVFVWNIYLSFKYLDTNNKSYILLAAIVSGIGIASKVSALIFISPVLLSLLIVLINSDNKIRTIALSFVFISQVFFWGVILSPYNFIMLTEFVSSMRYETGVATGQTLVFYTSQFKNTPVYIFQLLKIFPYVSGLPQYVFGIIGILLLPKLFIKPQKSLKYWTIILIPSFIYFVYFGQLYVKWTRFMSPIFFLFPLLAAFVLSKIRFQYLQVLLVTLCCVPGIIFVRLYSTIDIRLLASNWLIKTLPSKSYILTEGGNVVDIPIGSHQFTLKHYDFYNYDAPSLASEISKTDYIIVPSRRVFMNFEYTYYQHLFDGSMGFQEIKRFEPNTDLILNPEDAEETWSVFDRPTVRVYHKTISLDYQSYLSMLTDKTVHE